MKRLWLAIVEHATCPGSVPALFFSEQAPSDEEVIERVWNDVAPNQLDVCGMFDLTFAFAKDKASYGALKEYLDRT